MASTRETNRDVADSRGRRKSAAEEVEREVSATAKRGATTLRNAGLEFEAAAQLRNAAIAAGVTGVRDLTRADDMAVVAKRVSQLGEIVGAAGAATRPRASRCSPPRTTSRS